MRKTGGAPRVGAWLGFVRRTAAFATVATLALSVIVAGACSQTQAPPQVGGVAATAHPLASEAAIEMLSRGGNAVDAAVAAAFAIGVVEPDGSGLGGGGGMLVYMNDRRETIYINYYQCASADPGAASFVSSRDRDTAKSALVPGTVAGLCLALEKYGTLPLAEVLEPAIRYARDGFAVDATLAGLLLDFTDVMAQRPDLAEVFLIEGFPKMEGDTLQQSKLARTLELISQNGRDGFYKGETARALVERVTAEGGAMTLADLEGYEAEVSQPVRGTYRGYEIVSAPAPHSGATLIEIMNMIEQIDLDPRVHFTQSAETMHMLAEIFRRAYADRSQYLADPGFVHIPEAGLISKAYAREVLSGINPYRAEPRNYRDTPYGSPLKFDGRAETKELAQPEQRKRVWGDGDDDDPGLNEDSGDPFDRWKGTPKKNSEPKKNSDKSGVLVPEGAFEGASTTHISVIDANNNMVTLTQTLGNFWGSKTMVNGVLLNNGRVNFSTASAINVIEPNKRPRSSISPTLLFRDGAPAFALGSPGAGRIIAVLAQVIMNLVDYGMDVQAANDAPRFFCQKFDDHLSLESRVDRGIVERLSGMGHSVRVLGDMDLFFGGVQIAGIQPGTGELVGSADPRRGGNAVNVDPDDSPDNSRKEAPDDPD
jgi:gamma-glutamyltranspeptidase/glutathione hydrolase